MNKTQKRLQQLRFKLDALNIEAALISQPENRRYLSGFDGSAGFLLITAEKQLLMTDFRYTEQASKQTKDWEIYRTEGGPQKWLPKLAAGLGLKQISFEDEQLTVAEHNRLKDGIKEAGLKLKLTPMESLTEDIRAVKEAGEITLISRATQLADSAFEHLLNVVKPGMTEIEAALELELFMRQRGSEAMPFEIIVAAGANSALPHHQPSPCPIKEGEPVLVDFGAKIGGYASDFSRTFCLGTPDEKFRRLYGIVLTAQLAAINGICSGMNGHQADAIARNIIKKAGYGKNFGHSLGHGLGLDIHEEPRLGPDSPDVLMDGMAFTIEPGIYLPGWGGVRIEDTVVMECGKIRVLSQAGK